MTTIATARPSIPTLTLPVGLSDQFAMPASVWTHLSTDLQLRAIRLLAQLACARAAVLVKRSGQEDSHGPSNGHLGIVTDNFEDLPGSS